MKIYTDRPLPDYLTALLPAAPLSERPKDGVFLCFGEHGLQLGKAGEKGMVSVDFDGNAATYRRLKGGGELIAKAVNLGAHPTVWDATGGLGRDSFVLAGLGLPVRTFEQNPAVFALLCDGWQRAMQNAETADIARRMLLTHADAVQAMHDEAARFGRPDVVYLDPMYPERQKSAAVKKEMAYFHELVGLSAAQDDEALLHAARETAKKRVVVKRPRLSEFLAQKQPAYQYMGKSTRFDVYLPYAADAQDGQP